MIRYLISFKIARSLPSRYLTLQYSTEAEATVPTLPYPYLNGLTYFIISAALVRLLLSMYLIIRHPSSPGHFMYVRTDMLASLLIHMHFIDRTNLETKQSCTSTLCMHLAIMRANQLHSLPVLQAPVSASSMQYPTRLPRALR